VYKSYGGGGLKGYDADICLFNVKEWWKMEYPLLLMYPRTIWQNDYWHHLLNIIKIWQMAPADFLFNKTTLIIIGTLSNRRGVLQKIVLIVWMSDPDIMWSLFWILFYLSRSVSWSPSSRLLTTRFPTLWLKLTVDQNHHPDFSSS